MTPHLPLHHLFRMTRIHHLRITALFALLFAVVPSAFADESAEVVVVYNRAMKDSKAVADYYALKRQIPKEQVFGLELPTNEAISRAEFQETLQKPLLKKLEDQGLFTFTKEGDKQRLTAAKIRYLVMCYGVPVRILKDPSINEPEAEKLRTELRRNEASVDSELAWLPRYYDKPLLSGPMVNSLYGSTNATELTPTRGLVIVARLDGPSAAIAQGLVDKAMSAETNGLWGRAYFDIRGINEGGYKVGDDWIKAASEMSRRSGWETVVDDRPDTFPDSAPLSQIGLYAGWYASHVSGPFTHNMADFMPGAIAYHLHSFSGHTIRATDQYWVGPLLARGATATMGCVDEPYLEATPDLGNFFGRILFLGFSFGEAAYASQNVISWQTTVVGDPLYRPYKRKPRDVHEDLIARKDPLLEWSHLRVVNLNIVTGLALGELFKYLDEIPDTAKSAVLQEKLGDMYLKAGRIGPAIEAYTEALALATNPIQKIRLSLTLAPKLGSYRKQEASVELFEKFLKENPNYPDRLTVLRLAEPVAREIKNNELADAWKAEITRLTPPPTPTPAPQ